MGTVFMMQVKKTAGSKMSLKGVGDSKRLWVRAREMRDTDGANHIMCSAKWKAIRYVDHIHVLPFAISSKTQRYDLFSHITGILPFSEHKSSHPIFHSLDRKADSKYNNGSAI